MPALPREFYELISEAELPLDDESSEPLEELSAAQLELVASQAVDLLGITRTINVYECNGDYFMVDAARPMYSGDESDCTDGDR